MERAKVYLDQLTSRARNQTVRVKVIDKQPRQDNANKTSYQRMVLVDGRANKMVATLFGVDINVYENIIKRGRSYDITNAIVKDVPPRFATTEGEKQLYFTNSTDVVCVDDGASSSGPASPYTTIAALPADVSTDDRFDMIVIVLWVHPEKLIPRGETSIPVREITVTDDSNEQVLLVSAWNRQTIAKFVEIESLLLEDTVVELTALKVSRFSGFSMSASMSTEVILRPNNNRAAELRSWIASNQAVLDSRVIRAINNEAYVYPTEITTISDALLRRAEETLEGHILRLCAFIPDLKSDDLKFSVGCRVCGKACHESCTQLNELFDCDTCGVKKPAEAKVFFRFKCMDDTGTMTLDSYTKNSEKILRARAVELHTKTEEELHVFTADVQATLRAKPIELLISPVKNLLLNHGVIKWVLKDVAV